MLAYYESDKLKGERRWLPLDHQCYLEPHTKNRNFCWRIYGSHGMLKLQAKSQEEFKAWYEALSLHIQHKILVHEQAQEDDDV